MINNKIEFKAQQFLIDTMHKNKNTRLIVNSYYKIDLDMGKIIDDLHSHENMNKLYFAMRNTKNPKLRGLLREFK